MAWEQEDYDMMKDGLSNIETSLDHSTKVFEDKMDDLTKTP